MSNKVSKLQVSKLESSKLLVIFVVIPAKAGIQGLIYKYPHINCFIVFWIPAYAGMT